MADAELCHLGSKETAKHRDSKDNFVAQVPVVAGDEKQQGTVIVPKSKALEICTKGNERQG